MNRLRTSAAILTLTALQAFPAEGRGQGIVLREIAATRGSPTAPFGTICDMLQIEDGRIIVSDDVSGVLHAWSPEAGQFSIFARTGRGPGEVTTPTRLAPRPDGGFAVYDIGASAVFYFDRDGKPDGSTRIPGIVSNPKGMAIDSQGRVWLSGGRMTDPRHVHVFTPDGQRIAAYGEPSPHLRTDYPKIQAAGGALRRDSEGGILFSYGAPLRIVRFSPGATADPVAIAEDLKILPELREEEIYVPRPEIHPEAREFQWWHDRTTGVFVLPDGRLLNVITRFYKGDSVWDVYTPDGRLEHRTIVDKAYFAYHPTNDGRILAAYRNPDTDESVAVILEVRVGPAADR
ncbi:MAG: hypothetical protein FWJ74_08070 [Gemmatimonadota bacterium]